MAEGKQCPSCGASMYAEREDDERAGRYVTYVCQDRDCGHREKVFESYADGMNPWGERV